MLLGRSLGVLALTLTTLVRVGDCGGVYPSEPTAKATPPPPPPLIYISPMNDQRTTHSSDGAPTETAPPPVESPVMCAPSTLLNHTCLAAWPEYASVNASTSEACCALCLGDTRCVGWTMNAEQSPPCHLRPWSTATPTHKPGCTSGIIASRIPPPAPAPSPAPPGAKNVLFMVVDDLRPNLNAAYGQDYMITPNLDKFASGALVFRNAYCQYAYCAPSRNSFMSGRRPAQTKVYSFTDHFREVGPTWTSFPGLFKNNGYFTSGAGKTFHPGLPPNYDGTKSWSDLTEFPYINQYLSGDKCPNDGPGFEQWGRWCEVDDTQHQFGDELTANNSILHMTAAVARKLPFFVAAGFHRPHLPWSVPKKFFDMQPAITDIASPKYPNTPIEMPPIAWHSVPGPGFPTQWNVTLPPNSTDGNRRAYYAAVSFLDVQVGRLVDTVDALGVADNTIVVFTADHGWQLGEHNMYGKMSVFELATRVPLIIRDPSQPLSHGKVTMAFAELVDLMPTLAVLAGVPLPTHEPVPLGGISLDKVFKNPASMPPNGTKPYTLSQHARCWKDTHTPCGTTLAEPMLSATGVEAGAGPHDLHDMCDCHFVKPADIDFMGMSIRVPSFRYTEWHPWNGTTLEPVWEQLTGIELYPHLNDDGTSFDDFENVNVAGEPEYALVQKGLAQLLRQAFAPELELD